jgi:hypothetical protein
MGLDARIDVPSEEMAAVLREKDRVRVSGEAARRREVETRPQAPAVVAAT